MNLNRIREYLKINQKNKGIIKLCIIIGGTTKILTLIKKIDKLDIGFRGIK